MVPWVLLGIMLAVGLLVSVLYTSIQFYINEDTLNGTLWLVLGLISVGELLSWFVYFISENQVQIVGLPGSEFYRDTATMVRKIYNTKWRVSNFLPGIFQSFNVSVFQLSMYTCGWLSTASSALSKKNLEEAHIQKIHLDGKSTKNF